MIKEPLPIKKMADKIVDKHYQQNKNKSPFTQVAENAKNMLSYKMQDGFIENNEGTKRINTVKEALEVNEALDKNFQDHKQGDYLARLKHNKPKVITKDYDYTKLENVPILNRKISDIVKTNPTVQRYKDFKKEKEFNKKFGEEYSDRAIEKDLRVKEMANRRAGKRPYDNFTTSQLIVAEHAKDRAKEILKAINTKELYKIPTVKLPEVDRKQPELPFDPPLPEIERKNKSGIHEGFVREKLREGEILKQIEREIKYEV